MDDEIVAGDADDPAKPTCLLCQVGLHDGCLWAERPRSCSCLCPWLEADMTQHFPSLRENP